MLPFFGPILTFPAPCAIFMGIGTPRCPRYARGRTQEQKGCGPWLGNIANTSGIRRIPAKSASLFGGNRQDFPGVRTISRFPRQVKIPGEPVAVMTEPAPMVHWQICLLFAGKEGAGAERDLSSVRPLCLSRKTCPEGRGIAAGSQRFLQGPDPPAPSSAGLQADRPPLKIFRRLFVWRSKNHRFESSP